MPIKIIGRGENNVVEMDAGHLQHGDGQVILNGSGNTNHQMQNSAYRPDIDGLRTIAILSVLAYHAFPGVIHGGFIGVDVFFVISGFLIGRIIFRAFEAEAFSYADFYSRRVRRLFPALSLVLLACFIFGWFVLLPDELKQLGKHITGGVAFVSNLINWNEAGYFDNAAETKPLLHLWSLGVEEQFYIVFPVIVALATKYRRHYITIIGLAAALSFAYAVYIVGLNRTAAFYSPFSRFWELMAGCLLAYACLHRDQARFPARGLASVLGPVAILLGVVYIRQTNPFPGALALLPVVGSFLVIYAGPDAWVNRHILGSRLFVAIGLISYPLYLWHWPLLSYARIVAGTTPPLGLRIAAVVASFVLAYLTYRFVELPTRRRVAPRRTVWVSSAIMVAAASIGIGTVVANGIPTRQPILPYTLNAQPLFSKAQGWAKCASLSTGSSCWIVDPKRPAEVALLGDSHAAHLLDGMVALANANGFNVVARVRYGCLPFYTLNNDPRAFHLCGDEKGMDAEINTVIKNPTIKAVVLSGFAFQLAALDPEQFKHAMVRTLTALEAAGKQVVFMVDVPSLTFDAKECLHRRPIQLASQIRNPCDDDAAAYRKAQAVYLSIVNEVAQELPGVRFLDPSKWFIENGRIQVKRGGLLMYNDGAHITPAGSRYLFSKIGAELLADMGMPPPMSRQSGRPHVRSGQSSR
jgi:peptidoglycan/LPS O-acetylase OafA/YrhL